MADPRSADLPRGAFALAMRGMAVFELIPGGKKPLHKGGYKTASKDPDVTRARWTKDPSANIGIACGAVSGFWALDVDKQHGGIETLAELEARHGALPPTITVSTPNGGEHRYFRWHDGLTLRNSVARVGPGLDVRSTGGAVVAPPSRLSDGRRYWWKTNGARAFADAPAWLIEAATPPPPSPRTEPRPIDGDVSAYAAAAITDELNRLAEAAEGCRNDQLNRSAFAVAGFVRAGIAPEDWARALLEDCAIGIGLSVIEARGTIDSAFKAAQPREMPH